MNLLSKQMDVITVIAIVLMAISISILDFNNLQWSNNEKSYIGLLIVIIIIFSKYLINIYSKKQ
ncbi:hypothetical protein [uncultured Draconibacterium sp.]|uniref:hypothetical protein n=1 Tax=uncultured Draconibacterium sp. TaxID=1573823 RepID=UPI0029C82079|nr:hypothetical protein [uncultured Draconibacterium sp.]